MQIFSDISNNDEGKPLFNKESNATVTTSSDPLSASSSSIDDPQLVDESPSKRKKTPAASIPVHPSHDERRPAKKSKSQLAPESLEDISVVDIDDTSLESSSEEDSAMGAVRVFLESAADGTYQNATSLVGAAAATLTAGGPATADAIAAITTARGVASGISLNTVYKKVEQIEKDTSTVKGKVTKLEEDMSIVKGKVGKLEEDMSIVKGKVGKLEEDMSIVKGKVGKLEEDMSIVKGKVGKLEEDMSTVKKTTDAILKILQSQQRSSWFGGFY